MVVVVVVRDRQRLRREENLRRMPTSLVFFLISPCNHHTCGTTKMVQIFHEYFIPCFQTWNGNETDVRCWCEGDEQTSRKRFTSSNCIQEKENRKIAATARPTKPPYGYKFCQLLAIGRWFPLGTPVSSNSETDISSS